MAVAQKVVQEDYKCRENNTIDMESEYFIYTVYLRNISNISYVNRCLSKRHDL